MSVDFNNVLTRQHSGEEDVVGEGDKATFSQSIKYTVLIGKLLPLLGNLLLIEVGGKKESCIKTFPSMQHKPFTIYTGTGCSFVCVKANMCV